MTSQDTGEPPSWPRWATEAVSLVGYDPKWAQRGQREREHLHELLKPWLAGRIEHVSSTAVPGLAAKPIIDLQAPVPELAVAELIAGVLSAHDWHYVPPELEQRPYRRFFIKVKSGHRAAHLHLLLPDSARWEQQLTFRDTLRTRPDLAHAYGQLKTDLAQRHREDREAYTAGKHRFIQDVLAGRG